ncbi:MAG: hypothetical protein ACR2RF_01430 [Geminicoccaceae bacterium]
MRANLEPQMSVEDFPAWLKTKPRHPRYELVEVLSPSMAMRDASIKLEDSFRLPTIAHDLIIAPDRETVFHHRRLTSKIETEILHQGRLRLDPPGIEVEVKDFFGKS